MTNAELAAIPLHAAVRIDEDGGQIIQAGQECRILWEDERVSVIDTRSQIWEGLVQYIEKVNPCEFD